MLWAWVSCSIHLGQYLTIWDVVVLSTESLLTQHNYCYLPCYISICGRFFNPQHDGIWGLSYIVMHVCSSLGFKSLCITKVVLWLASCQWYLPLYLFISIWDDFIVKPACMQLDSRRVGFPSPPPPFCPNLTDCVCLFCAYSTCVWYSHELFVIICHPIIWCLYGTPLQKLCKHLLVNGSTQL